MTDVSGIPNMGFGGGGYFGGSAALGLPAMSANQINAGIWGNYSPGAAQSTLSNIYGAGGFGAQPAYYAALGAAYGRQVAPSSPAAVASYWGGGGYPGGAVQRGADLPAPDTSGYDPLSRGTPQYDPWTGAWTGGYSGGGIGSDAARTAPQPANPYAQMYRMPAANPSYFNPGTYAGDKNNYGLPAYPAGGGVPTAPKNGPYPNLGYNPGMANYFANPGMSGGAFQSRFGMNFPNAGTPSQYAPGAQMPPGFSGTYSVDNPSGALPLGEVGRGPGGGYGIYSNSPFGN